MRLTRMVIPPYTNRPYTNRPYTNRPYTNRPYTNWPLREQVGQNAGRSYAYQRLVPAFVREGILLVVDPQQVLHGGMDVTVAALEVPGSRISQFIGLPVIESGLQPRAGHPHTESVRIV